MFIERLQRFGARFFSFIVIPAMLPGDPQELLSELLQAPVETLRTLNWAVAGQLLQQYFACECARLPRRSCLC